MSVVVPTVPATIAPGDLAAGQKIVGESSNETEWTDLVEAAHWQLAYAGVRICGRHWNPVWSTTEDTNFIATNSTGGGDDLDSWRPAARLLRARDDGQLVIVAAAFGKNVDIQWELIRRDSDATRHSLATKTFSIGGTASWATTSFAQSEASISDNGSASSDAVRIEHSVRAREANDSATHIHQTAAWALVLSASEIPRR